MFLHNPMMTLNPMSYTHTSCFGLTDWNVKHMTPRMSLYQESQDGVVLGL